MTQKFFLLALVLTMPVIGLAQVAPPLFLKAAAERAGLAPSDFSKICDFSRDAVSARVLREYGAVLVAERSVKVPKRCVFTSAGDVSKFHQKLDFAAARIGTAEIVLQSEAMRALLSAIDEASADRLRITPLDGRIAGTRDYNDTVRLWNSRFDRALAHWQRRGRISPEDAQAARNLPPFEQVPLVLNWESRKLWFSTGFDRSILTSVAAPGTSQHLSGLAFDIVEYRSSRVRNILNKHGWYQTVLADEPHFTYLGRPESDLESLGLISKSKNGYKFWVPAIP